MGNCINCGKELKRLGSKDARPVHTPDGDICAECAGKLPYPANESVGQMSAEDIKIYADYEEEMRSLGFSETTSLGSLKMDDLHGLFALEIGEEMSVYSILGVTNFSIAGDNYHESRSHRGKLVCDAVFECDISRPRIHIKTTVMKGIECNYKRVSHDHVQPEVPSIIILMNSVFSQTYRNQAEKLTSVYNSRFISQNAIDVMKSELVLMMHDGYEKEDVLEQKERLMNAYEDSEDRAYYQQRIEKAADILILHLKEEGGGDA